MPAHAFAAMVYGALRTQGYQDFVVSGGDSADASTLLGAQARWRHAGGPGVAGHWVGFLACMTRQEWDWLPPNARSEAVALLVRRILRDGPGRLGCTDCHRMAQAVA